MGAAVAMLTVMLKCWAELVTVMLCESSKTSCILIPRIDEDYVAFYCTSTAMRSIWVSIGLFEFESYKV